MCSTSCSRSWMRDVYKRQPVDSHIIDEEECVEQILRLLEE